MDEPCWVSKRAVLALHEEQLAEHGGSSGIRDESLLDSALAKPQNVFACADDPGIFRLAASYAFGIARNHAFVDGNKRTALVACILFLNRNGWDITASKTEEYETFLRLAEGSLGGDELTAWLTRHAVAV
ncbi:MAG: type II toxin-antitoxin system death-on-curing family toxin [Acidobacteriaceae bacterium]